MNIRSIFGGQPKRIFLDYASSTPVRTEVLDVVHVYDKEFFANPSALYKEARDAKEIYIQAKKDIGLVLNAPYSSVVMTSGGTESNNLALLGIFEKARQEGIEAPHIISLVTEHPAVREVLEEIKRRGGEVTLVTPQADGRVTASMIEKELKDTTVLVSVLYVNNEIGVVQPIREIAQMIRNKRKDTQYPYVHTDACQAPLWYSLDVSTLGVDLMSLDGIKIGGPRGVGCLYVKPNTKISPIVFGGGQEGGLRSGTEPVSLGIGFALALTLAKKEREELVKRVTVLRDTLLKKIQTIAPSAHAVGSLAHRTPNNLTVCFPSYDAEYMVVACDTYGLAVSYSSSCRTLKEDSSSYVIEALNPECKDASIRFSLGIHTTEADIHRACEIIEKVLVQTKP